MRRSAAEARADLREHEPQFATAFAEALALFIDKTPPELKKALKTGTEAGFVHDLFREQLASLFEGHPEVSIEKRGNLDFIKVGDRYEIRFKKMRGGFRVSHIPTQAVLDFMRQHHRRPEQFSFPNMRPPTNLILGYQPQGPELKTARLFIVCPDGSRIDYWWEITPSAAALVHINRPAAPDPAHPQVRRARVRSSSKVVTKKKNENKE